jgi:hypothetical protein
MQQEPSMNKRALIALCLCALMAAAVPVPAAATPAPDAGPIENRCGWVVNPTPGNWRLTDAQATWIIATQGRDDDPGMDKVGDIAAGDYVKTNGLYGHACGCMRGWFDKGQTKVVQILSFTQKPIAACTSDPRLPKDP